MSGGVVRLIRRPVPVPAGRSWGDETVPLFTDDSPTGWQPWQILGGPGTGKTSLLTDVATHRIGNGVDPESILVVTHSRRAATNFRDNVVAGLVGTGAGTRATREPLVRTVHSYAFGVLRLQAAAHGNPPPRLLTGAEQDAIVREMLRGDLADDPDLWPQRLQPALAMTGFADELRALMARAIERGFGPEDLVKLGRKHAKPEWVAAGRFAIRYEQAMLLRWSVGVEAPEASAPALDAAELVGAALVAFAADRELLARERSRIRYLLVDDAQHLDPQAAELIRVIGSGTAATVIAGDPDQSIFTFRGADPAFVANLETPRRIVLRTNHRAATSVAETIDAVAARLPGRPPHRGTVPATTATGDVRVKVLASEAKEAALIADTLRRAHITDGVPWSRMAVIVRSVPVSIAPLRRALSAAGVPVSAPVSDTPLAARRSASALLNVLRAVSDPQYGADDALDLLTGPVGGADPVAVRRIRRALRRVELANGGERESAELLCLAILGRGTLDGLTDVEAVPVRRAVKVVARARSVHAQGGGIEEVLWAAWQSSGLERRWVQASGRGGSVGAQADRDLDAAVALFEEAAGYVDRLPRASLPAFVEHIRQQQISSDRRTSETQSVAMVSAHSAAGREWDVVAVAGVQEGLWPGLRTKGSLLGADTFVDITNGAKRPDDLSRTAPQLADERRLLLVACSRARRTLLVTSVESTTGDRDLMPSRFVTELAGEYEVVRRPGRVLALASLVAELRTVVCDPNEPERRRDRAAHQLARLAAAGVKAADPDHWYGVGGTSTTDPLWTDDPVQLSPSNVELLRTCPLRWALEKRGGTDGDAMPAVTGSLVHTLVQAIASGVPPAEVQAALETAWEAMPLGTGWLSRRELKRNRAMLDTFAEWLRTSRIELTEVGVEVDVRCDLEPPGDGPTVRITGRIDRLERDQLGRPVIVDVKTGRNPVSKNDCENHAQLATYQVAAAEGGVDGEPAAEPGGGRLVYVSKPHNKDGATQRSQPALDEAAVRQWRATIHEAAAATQGPRFLATVNDGCRHCPVSASCPAQDTGRQVTE